MESAFQIYQNRLKGNKNRRTVKKKSTLTTKKKIVASKQQKTKEVNKKTIECDKATRPTTHRKNVHSKRVFPSSNAIINGNHQLKLNSPTSKVVQKPKLKKRRKLPTVEPVPEMQQLLSSEAPSDFYLVPQNVFRWMISPIEPEDFFKTYWEKTPIHIKRNKQNTYQQILSTEKLQSIFLENVLLYTRNIDVVSYTNGQRETHNAEGRAVPAALWDYYKNGCSIRILNPHTYCGKLHSLLASLQEYFGCMAGVNAYLTPPGSQGFAPHYDDIEAFILQLEGRKHWRLRAPLTASDVLPRYSSKNFERDELNGQIVTELTLEAGDLLYFPRGTIHEGFTDADEHSLHITISVYQKTAYVDLLEHALKYTLRTAAVQDVEFREGLPLQYLKHAGFANGNRDTKSRDELKAKVKKLLTKMIDHLDIDSAADELGKQFMWDSMPPIPTKVEKEHMMHLNGEMLLNGKIYNTVDINLNIEVRLLRYHCLRLVKDDEAAGCLRIYYNTDNAKYYHGEELQFLVVDYAFEGAIKCLIHSYPKFVEVRALPLKNDNDKMQIVSDLWEKGLLVTKNPLVFSNEMNKC